MGWANCGTDSEGRPRGYAHEAICDYPGCAVAIHRGLAYACGGMHGTGDGYQCEGYFCPEHLQGWAPDATGRMRPVCASCERQWRAEDPAAAAAWDEE